MPEQALTSRIPHEALVSLRHRLATLPARHPNRKHLVANAAALYRLMPSKPRSTDQQAAMRDAALNATSTGVADRQI